LKALFQKAIFNCLKEQIVRFAKKRQIPPHDHAAIHCETCAIFFAKIDTDKFRGEAHWTTYIMGIARVLCLQYHCKKGKYQGYLVQGLDEDEHHNVVDDSFNMEQVIITAEVKKIITEQMEKRFSQLPIIEQEVLILWNLGCSHKEIAETLGLANENVSKTLLCNAKRRLREFAVEFSKCIS
jgi:RNA polymerase sigma factor (sigma-70 family)